MKCEQCPECSQKLIFLQSSNRYICRSCGGINQQKNKEVEQVKNLTTTFTPETIASLKAIPVEIKVVDGERSVTWNAAEMNADTLTADFQSL